MSAFSENRAVVSTIHKQLLLKNRTDVSQLLPHAKKFAHNGDELLAIPHGGDEVRLLNNIGIHAPAPVLYYYDWSKDTPFASQKETAALLSTSRRAYVTSEMGVGKTRACIYAADYLMHTNAIRKVLVVGPLSTLTPVWHSEIFRYFPHRSSIVVHGTRAKRLTCMDQDVDFYIINHDALQIIQDKVVERGDIDLIIFDELTAFRTATTRRWKQANRLAKSAKYAWGLTGSPIPNAPTDAFGQVRLLTPERVPRSFKHFRDKTMLQVTQFKWVPKREAVDIVQDAMKPSVRFTRDECLDIPPVTTVTRTAAMSPVQQDFYQRINTVLRADYKNHKITAVNAGVQLSKLLQVCGGYVYTDDKRTLDLSPVGRLAAMDTVIDESARKVIVFAPFIHTVNQVFLHIRNRDKKKDPDRVAYIYGATPKKQRDLILNEFQNGSRVQYLVAHPQCLSHGVTLTAADTIIWYLPTDSNEIYEQACARISRAGQTHKQLIVHLEGSQIESVVYKRLQNKQSVQNALLDLFTGVDEAA